MKCNILLKTANYEEARVNFTNTQLSKLRSSAKRLVWNNIENAKKTFQTKNCHMNYF